MADKVAVVTDSVACLTKELVEEYNIRVVPVELIFEDKVYRDGIDLSPSEFYTLLKQAKRLPTTAAPSHGAYLEAYRDLSERAESIVCITVAAKLSGVFNSAMLAKEMAREALPQTRIEVIDSRTAAGAQAFVVLAAARAAAAGQDFSKITQAAESMIPRMNLVVVMDTLYYLAKGGRIPKVAAWGGSTLNLKPILEVGDRTKGKVIKLGMARSKQRGAERLLGIMKERAGARDPVHVFVVHTNVPDEAEALKTRISSEFNCNEIYVTDFTPVMGAHTGPGLLGVAFYSESIPAGPRL